MILSVRLVRKDQRFLKGLSANLMLVGFLENLLLSFPFIIILILSPYPLLAGFVLAACYSINFLNVSIISRKKFTFKTFVPSYLFEWISGIRANYFYLLLLYITLLIYPYELGSPVLGIILLSLLVPAFYLECEPWVMIEAYKLSMRRFLFFKLTSALKIFFLMFSPFILCFLVFHYERWYLAAGLMLLASVIVVSCVLTKYAFYTENSRLGYLNLIITGIIIFSIISSFYLSGILLLPLPFFMLIYLYKKALRNLNDISYA